MLFCRIFVGMDIALLSKMVKVLLSKSDSVTLPGFGRFELEDVPASFSDKGFTINPPYKKVIFTPTVGEDNLLCESYAKANGVSISRAKDLIMECVYGIVSDLKNSKQVEFPDFGRLKMTRGGTVLFVAIQDLVLRPQFDMLAPISLKSLDLAVAAELNEVMPVAAEPVASAELEPVAEVVTSESEPATPSNPEVSDTSASCEAPSTTSHPARAILWTILSIILLAAVALGLLAVLGRTAPDFVDQFLYTPQELQILRTVI